MSYGEYNGDTVHDMWVDSTYSAWTGESPYYDSPVGGYYVSTPRSVPRPSKIRRLEMRLENMRNKIEQLRKLQSKKERFRANHPVLSNKARKRLNNSLEDISENIKRIEDKIAILELELRELKKKRDKKVFVVASILIVAFSVLMTI